MCCYGFLSGSLALLVLIAGSVWALPPQVQDVTITDVTPVSFSVIWASDQPSTCELMVFADVNGIQDITVSLTITPHPTRNNVPAVVTAAQNRGVMKTRVSGLAPATTYYFQTRTTSLSANEDTLYPSSAPYPAVTTAQGISKTTAVGIDQVPFTNDLIYRALYEADGTTAAHGALLVATVADGRYPLSGFVGDGFAGPLAVIDLNNLYSASTGETMAVQGGQKITLAAFYGIQGQTESALVVPRNLDLLAARPPIGLADAILILQALTVADPPTDLSLVADCNQDGGIGLAESMHILQVVSLAR